ncbi:hypothetical protein FS749_008624 [Ceratobasidium sp. UAMH 11750]|nr:hypothetical protein FS749_008624 [Ceratobasidium sp. UAMH 11750]
MVRVALAAALVASVSAAHHPNVFARATSSNPGPAAASVPDSFRTTSSRASSTPVGSVTSSAAPTSTAGTITPVPTGTLPDNYFVQGVTPRTWSQALALAAKFVAPMSVEEKVSLTTGLGFGETRCVGNIAAQPKYKFPGLCLQDSPLGVRLTDHVSAFSAGINAAATWDRDLIRARGVAMGQEFRGKGVNIALGPMMNLGRVAAAGRNWEGFGADPFLTGEAAYQSIVGIQSTGVQAW